MRCKKAECLNSVYQSGLCKEHHHPSGRVRKFTTKPVDAVCSIKDCTRAYHAKGFCRKHYASFWRYGDASKRFRNDKGSGSVNKNGYHLITIKGEQVFEHRYLVEQLIGRKLLASENVHYQKWE